MDLGVRQIRTAGRGSGSIELTLPTDLRDLVGLPCRIILRDGSRPDIVLQPDLQTAHRAFAALWQAMAATLLREDANTPALPLTAFSFGLQPRTSSGGMPFLSWRDGLALAASPPHEAGAVSRTVAAFGHALADALKIDPALASGFGAACGFMLSGVPATSDAQEACDLAALHLGQPTVAPPLNHAGDAKGSVFWRLAVPLLMATAHLFIGWSMNQSDHAMLRAAWRHGRTIEMS